MFVIIFWGGLMDEVKQYLRERKEELESHLALLENLEKASMTVQNPVVDIKQVLILKASILLHLYNIIEAIMAKTLEVLEVKVFECHPRDYRQEFFSAWVETNIRASNELNISKLNERATVMARELIESSGWSKLVFQKTDGNWDNKRIEKFTDKYGIKIIYTQKLKKKIFEPYYDNLGPIEYIRKRRNDLAHGFITFEEGADNKTHAELRSLADLTITFLDLVINGCEKYITDRGFLSQKAV